MSHKRRSGPPPCHFCECGDHAWAPATAGRVTLVDTDDAHLLAKCLWYTAGHGYGYARGTIDGRTDSLHRLVAGTAAHLWTDHKNRNTMDNRRRNLRQCSPTENHGNAVKQSRNSSGFKGVRWDTRENKWYACVRANKRVVSCGYFRDATSAAKAYNKKAGELFGEFALLNDVVDQ